MRIEADQSQQNFHTGDEVLIEAEKNETVWNLKTLIKHPQREDQVKRT